MRSQSWSRLEPGNERIRTGDQREVSGFQMLPRNFNRTTVFCNSFDRVPVGGVRREAFRKTRLDFFGFGTEIEWFLSHQIGTIDQVNTNADTPSNLEKSTFVTERSFG